MKYLIHNIRSETDTMAVPLPALIFTTSSPDQPDYLSELLNFHTTARQLRSSKRRNCLYVPCTTSSFAACAFFSFAPRLCNDLPSHL